MRSGTRELTCECFPDEYSLRIALKTESRFHAVNVNNMRAFRKRLGWSQAELSRRSGYSERVIRKAEAGGTLKMETIQHLAEALSNGSHVVTFQDLTQDDISIARLFVESYDRYGQQMVLHCGKYIAEDFELHVPADPERVPFAGIWRGVAGLQEFMNRFFGTFSRVQGSLQPNFMSGDNRVVAHYEDVLYFQGHELPAIWVNLHFHMREGMIVRIDDEFDNFNASQALDQLLAKLQS